MKNVKARDIVLEFPVKEGVILPAEITLKLTAQDFYPPIQHKNISIPPDGDCGPFPFSVVPKKTGNLILNLEVLKEEISLVNRIVRTTAIETKLKEKISLVILSIPMVVFVQTPPVYPELKQSQSEIISANGDGNVQGNIIISDNNRIPQGSERKSDEKTAHEELWLEAKDKLVREKIKHDIFQKTQILKQVVMGFTGVLVLFLAGFLFYKIDQIQGSLPGAYIITATPFPTVPVGFIFIGQLPEGANAQVTSPNGNITPLTLGQILVAPGSQIDVSSGVISIGLPDGSALYLVEGTSLKFISIMDPSSANKESVLSLNKGAVMVKVVSGSVVVQAFDGIVAGVSGSIMGVQLGDYHYVDCYEGHCGISGNIATPIDSMDGDRRYLAMDANQMFTSSIPDRCQAWESMLGPTFNQLGIQPCLTNTPTP